MNQPQPTDPAEAAPGLLLGDLHLEEAREGRLEVCRQAALTHRAQQLLGTEAPPHLYLPADVAPDLGATHSLGAPSPVQHICHKLVWALEFLELISVNLLRFPWRKEIRSLKELPVPPHSAGCLDPAWPLSCSAAIYPTSNNTRLFRVYTGNFAYWVQPVLSKHTLHSILGRLGYMATFEAEFSLVQAVSEEDTKQMVFEIFLCHASTRSDSEEFLTCYRDLVLHQAALFSKDIDLGAA